MLKRLLHVRQSKAILATNGYDAVRLKHHSSKTLKLGPTDQTQSEGSISFHNVKSRKTLKLGPADQTQSEGSISFHRSKNQKFPLRKIPASGTKRFPLPKSKPHISNEKPSGVCAGFTWFTKNPALVDLDQLRSLIPRYCDQRQMMKTIMVLATPSLAPLLEAGDFLKDLLPSLYHGRRSSEGREAEVALRCVYAVTDALPTPPSHVGHGSSEGLAILLSSYINIRGSSYIANATPVAAEMESTTTIRFASRFGPEDAGARAASSTVVARQVSLPVANTIFVNGQRATLFEDTLNVKLTESDEATISLVHRRLLASYRFHLHCHPKELVIGGSTSLHRLTEPRKVVRSMGNVLAQIEVGGNEVPASQELEKAVPAYIESNPTSTVKGPLLVYALIRPDTMISPYKADVEAEMRSSSSVLDDLWGGAKLFKVSGGGGGWGKRQGLLSLEAGVNFATSEIQATAGLPDLDKELTVAETLGIHRMIPESSTVEFVVHTPSPASTPSPDQEHTAPLPEKEGTTVMLGTALDPDSYDGLVKSANSIDTVVQFVPNHFGMISYGGAALESSTRNLDPLPNRQRSKRHVETRLDVPDSMFVLRSVGQHRTGDIKQTSATA